MSNKELFYKTFKDIEPSDELVERTLRQEIKTPSNRKRLKRGVAAAIALAALSVFTVSAAAISGIIDFNELFGNRFTVENEETAEKLIRNSENVRNFSYNVNSDDYYIELKGVAGDAKNVMVVTEIKRKDGAPVVEHCNDPASVYYGKRVRSMYASNPFSELDCDFSHYHGAFINDMGNIEMNTDYMSNSILSGKKIWALGDCFYTIDDSQSTPNMEVRVTLLELQWEFSFDYYFTEENIASKSCSSPAESFAYYETVRDEVAPDVWQDTIEYENTADLVLADISSANGYFIFEFRKNQDIHEYNMSHKAYSHISDRNNIYLIKNDGTIIPAVIEFGHISYGNNNFRGCYNFYYGNDSTVKEVIDTKEIAAININGTTYELS